MPTLEDNLNLWDKKYDWSEGGDEWSAAWGSPVVQWEGSILPRMRQFIPASHIVELAPGRGRWTQFLVAACEKLSLVDLSPTCIDACRERFASEDHVEYHVNDGVSLPAEIEDGSVDFIFCFDSFVHCEMETMSAYLDAFKAKLKPGGHAFIHHSNLGEYRQYFGRLDKLKRGRPTLEKLKIIEPAHFRALSVTAEKIRTAAHEKGLTCLLQECIPWLHNRRLVDAISTFRNTPPEKGFETTVWRNKTFEREARILKQRGEFYPVR